MINKSNNKRKILQILCLIIIIVGLIISIAFSGLNISTKTLLNSRYSGGYKALVEVYDSNLTTTAGSSQIANGNAQIAAASLEKKLSPFSDNTIDIKVVGEHRLAITSTKEQYNSNQTTFKNAIEQDGGLLALTSEYKDILFDDTTMTKVTGANVFTDGEITQKIAISDIFGAVRYSPEPDQTGQAKNAPFLVFSPGEQSTYLDKLAASTTDESTSQTTNQQLTLISSMESIINNLRQYYSFYSSSQQSTMDAYLLDYYYGVIVPLQTVYANADDNTKAVLDDLFAINYQVKHGNQISEKTGSLIGNNLDFWWQDVASNHRIQGNDEEVTRQLKAILYGQYTDPTNPITIDNYQFSFINPASKYVIDANSVTDDFVDETGKYVNNFTFSLNNNVRMKINEVADIVNQTLLKSVLFTNVSEDVYNTNPFNQRLDQNIFNKNFIMINGQIDYSGSGAASQYGGAFIKDELKVQMGSATIAKTIEASIAQTTSGYSFRVVRITEFNPDVTIIMLIASLALLLLLAVLALAYLVYFYRLLGIYTLIIAVTSIAITLMVPTLFGIAIGIETITMVFVILAIVLDACVIFIESFKKHLNQEKRSQLEAFKLSNKENASSIFDLILLVVVPNVILFWISSGSLKNLATIAVVSTFATLILILVIFRTMFWLTVKANMFKKNPLLLPLDTSMLNNFGSVRLKLKLAKIDYKLSELTTKASLNAKELLIIKKLNDQKLAIEAKIVNQATQHTKKLIAKHQQLLNKNAAKMQLVQPSDKTRNPFKMLKRRLQATHQQTLLANKAYSQAIVQQASDDEIKRAYVHRQTRISLNVNKILVSVTLLLAIIGSILAMTIGPSYSTDFGRDKTFIVYGDYVDNFETGNYEDVYDVIANNSAAKATALNNIRTTIAEKHQNDDVNYSPELASATIAFIYQNNLINLFSNNTITGANTVEVIYGDDYLIQGTEDTTGWVQITLSNRASLARNRLALKRIIVNTEAVWNGSENEIYAERGILGMNQSPFTAIGQVQQILIAFGILLLALIVYIAIRFKWTYYVALALGIIIVGSITASLVIVFRVPISYELLSTFVAVISFAILSMIIILGRIRSAIGAKNKNQLAADFNAEIMIKSKLHHESFAYKKQLNLLKTEYKPQIKQAKQAYMYLKVVKITRFKWINQLKMWCAWKVRSDELTQAKAVIKTAQTSFKTARKALRQTWVRQKKAIHQEFNATIKHNQFMQYISNDTTNYAIKKILIIGIFYFLFALILVVTIPAIIGVGLTLFIGIFITYVFILSTAIPITVILEKRRIAKKFAYRDFIKDLPISSEEQIVKDIND